MTAWKNHNWGNDAAREFSRILRERLAPDVTDALHRDVVKFMNCKRVDQTMDTYLMEFDVTREKAETRMATGSGFPDEFASVLRTHNAVPENGKSLEPASIRRNPTFPEVSSRMRRLFGPRGSAARQDVLAAADLDAVSEEEGCAAWVAYRKVRKDKKREGRGRSQ